MAPLPKDLSDPVLTKMLARAPYQVPSGEDKERHGEAKGGLNVGGTSRIPTGEINTPVSEDERGGDSSIPSPHGKKRTAPEDLEAEVSKRGKKTASRGPAPGGNIAAQRPHGASR